MGSVRRSRVESAGFGLDPLARALSIYAPARANRPGAFHIPKIAETESLSRCPFCPGHEDETPPEWIASREAPGSPWQARIFPNRFAAVPSFGSVARGSEAHGAESLYGFHDVVIESARHDPLTIFAPKQHATRLWEMILGRLGTLSADPRVAHLVWFRNQGSPAGASLEHPHSQIIGINRMPPGIAARNAAAKRFYSKHRKSWVQESRSVASRGKKRIVLDDEGLTVLCPESSRVCYEMQVIPRRPRNHCLPQTQEAAGLANVLRRSIAALQCVSRPEVPFNMTLQISPPRTGSWFTWHVEILPRMSQVAGWEWATGSFINPIPPDVAAKRLREALSA